MQSRVWIPANRSNDNVIIFTPFCDRNSVHVLGIWLSKLLKITFKWRSHRRTTDSQAKNVTFTFIFSGQTPSFFALHRRRISNEIHRGAGSDAAYQVHSGQSRMHTCICNIRRKNDELTQQCYFHIWTSPPFWPCEKRTSMSCVGVFRS